MEQRNAAAAYPTRRVDFLRLRHLLQHSFRVLLQNCRKILGTLLGIGTDGDGWKPRRRFPISERRQDGKAVCLTFARLKRKRKLYSS